MEYIIHQRNSGSFHNKAWKFSNKNTEECRICSNALFHICHPHISTHLLEYSLNTQKYFCSICKKQHPKHKEGRQNLVLGSSTLHNIWKVSEYRPKFHIDFDCIIGGKINDVHASFIYQFTKMKEPLDVIIACGANNIPTSDSAQDIIFQFKLLVKAILQHSHDLGHAQPSRVIISSLLYAPKYCDSRLNPKDNKVEKVRLVNKWIQEYNKDATGKQLNLHLHGVIGNPDYGQITHRYEDFRELNWQKKLHCSQRVKGKIAVDLMKLFSDLKSK